MYTNSIVFQGVDGNKASFFPLQRTVGGCKTEGG